MEEELNKLSPDFISQYKKMRAFCAENNLLCYVHGTGGMTDLPVILESGLNVKSDHQIGCNAVCVGGLKKEDIDIKGELEMLLNYQHKDSRQFIMLGIPAVCNYLQNVRAEMENGADDETAYQNAKGKTMPLFKSGGNKPSKIPADFLIAGVDIENQNIMDNPNFSVQHNYEGLEMDIDGCGHSLAGELNSEFSRKVKRGLMKNNCGWYTTERGNEFQITKNDDGTFLMDGEPVEINCADETTFIFMKDGNRNIVPIKRFIPDGTAVPSFACQNGKIIAKGESYEQR